jgi:outer membrane protein TolC
LKRVALLAAVLALPVAAQAQGGEVLTLDRAIALSLENNRQLRNASLDVQKSQDQIESNRTQRLPQLQLNVTPGYRVAPLELNYPAGSFGTYPPPVGPIPAQNTTLTTSPGYTTFIQFQLSQPLSQIYKIGLGLDQAGIARDMSSEDLRNLRNATVANVRQAYYAALQSQSSLEALKEQATASREVSRVLAEQAAREAALQGDLLQARASAAKADYDVASTERMLATQKEQLNYLLGRAAGTPFRLDAAPPAAPLALDLEAAQQAALRQRPDLRKANLNVSFAEYNVRLKQAEYIPDVSLVYKYTRPVTSDILPQNISFVGLELSWDVFDWGRKSHDRRQRERALAQARTAVDDTASQVLLDVNSSFRKLQDAEAYLQVAELSRDAAREKLRVAANQYRQQAVLLKDLLNAQTSLAQASDQYRQAVLNYWDARAGFEKAIGASE